MLRGCYDLRMLAALDVHYDDTHGHAIAAAVVFSDWLAQQAIDEYTATIEHIAPYVPGEFFRRELPCLLAVIAKIVEPLDCLIIDGYVRLNDRPGLGQHLHDALGQRIPVIGVAKTRFANAPAIEVFRGASRSALFVTAIGIDPQQAADDIRAMHGEHRLPTMLSRADRLARSS
jgi:deoxyribonuclease V